MSDEEYLRQLSSAGLEVQRSTHLPQMGEVSYVFADDWQDADLQGLLPGQLTMKPKRECCE